MDPAAGRGRGVMRRHGWAMVALGVATLGAVLGSAAAGYWLGGGARLAVVAALAGSVLWTGLASSAASAPRRDTWGSLLRAASVTDSAGVALLLLAWWWRGDESVRLTLLAVAKCYGVLVCVGLAGWATTRLSRRWRWRAGLAVLFAGLILVSLTSPVWIGPMMDGRDTATAAGLATWAVRVNPFYALCDATAEGVGFRWHTWGRMYEWSRLGEYISPGPVGWWETCLVFLTLGAAMGLLAWGASRLRRIRAKNREHADRSRYA